MCHPFIHSLIHFIHPFIHSFTSSLHSFMHSFIQIASVSLSQGLGGSDVVPVNQDEISAIFTSIEFFL